MIKVYLETSFISRLVARPSRDIVVAAQQQITLDWWAKESTQYELFASEFVLQEARLGDPVEVGKRLAVLSQLTMLDTAPAVDELAAWLIERHALPAKAAVDALHIAVAAFHGMDY